jgi:hypothetical protein
MILVASNLSGYHYHRLEIIVELTIEEIAQNIENKYLYELNSAEKNKAYFLKTYPEDLELKEWSQIISKLPLAKQCEELGIVHEKLGGLSYGKKPEIEALRYFSDHGYVGAYCEGGPILLLIRAAALDVIAQLDLIRWRGNEERCRNSACTGYTESSLVVCNEGSEYILNAIRCTDVNHVVRNFSEIYMHESVQERSPGLTSDIMAALFMSIGAERLAQITEEIMKNPYCYRSGWPDLTMTNGSDMLWVEIKTKDRLHISQIMTISRMKTLLPGEIRVVQLTKT